MTTACIIQARLGSTRLPAKVLLPLPTGRTVLEEVLHRCKQIPGVDVVVCAIPDTPENDILVPFIQSVNKAALYGPTSIVQVARGSEHDVLARYAKAAEAVKADVIMRVTSDCPLIDPEVCGRVLGTHLVTKAPYVSNTMPPRKMPQGLDCEVFTDALLHAADAEAVDAYDREHVTPWMQRSECVRIGHSEQRNGQAEDRSHLRWTLDAKEDYVRIWNIFLEQMQGKAA